MSTTAWTIRMLCLAVSLFPFHAHALSSNDIKTANYYLSSGPELADENTIRELAYFDLLILPSEAQVYHPNFFARIRTVNPDILLLAYVPTVSFNYAYWSDPLHQDLLAGIHPAWWLTNADGTRQSIWPNTWALNLQSDWPEYLARFTNERVIATGLWDGVFFDEVGDSAAWRDGYRRVFERTRELVGPQVILITNGSSDTLYRPATNGRMFESFPTPWEGNGRWSTVMRNYLSLEQSVGQQPKVLVLNSDTGNTGAQQNYRAVRFGLGSTLLGDGYFGFDFGTQDHRQIWRYDEYEASLGAAKNSPSDLLRLGQTDLSESVWTRDFERGKVVVNATDASQLVRLGGEYEKLHGAQDPVVNNGSIVSRVRLEARDGLLLLRPLEQLTQAVFPNGAFARIFDGAGAVKRTGFFAYEPEQKGGTRIWRGDINRDGKNDWVVVSDSTIDILSEDGTVRAHIFPYGPQYHGGINFAIGDVENDGTTEIVTGTGPGGGPHVRVFDHDGQLINPGFFAYDPKFRGGVHVALGDINGDGIQEVLTGAGAGGGPHVRVFNKHGKLLSPGFFAYRESFRGGVHVAAGDVDGDGRAEIITGPGKGGGPHVRVFDATGAVKAQFFAFDATERDGVVLTATDADGDGRAEIVAFTTEVFTLAVE